MNKVRIFWSIFYCVAGIIGLTVFACVFFSKIVISIRSHFFSIMWCIAWSAVGIGLGLYNSRIEKSETLHYVTYFPFVLFLASLAAFAAFLVSPTSLLRAYVFSALAGIVVGFSGDKLAGDILKVR